MYEILMSMRGPFVIGLLLGVAYTRGACIALDIGPLLRHGTFFLAILAGAGVYLHWPNVIAGSVVGIGVCVVVALRLCWLKHCLPYQLRRSTLAARRGEEEPGLGFVDGLWVMSYRNGQTMCYDTNGKIRRIGFPDGSQWDLVDAHSNSASV